MSAKNPAVVFAAGVLVGYFILPKLRMMLSMPMPAGSGGQPSTGMGGMPQ